MGGDGTIGGGKGSCHLKFRINDDVEVLQVDHQTENEFWVEVRFPNGGIVKRKVDPQEEITFKWPVKAPNRREEPKQNVWNIAFPRKRKKGKKKKKH